MHAHLVWKGNNLPRTTPVKYPSAANPCTEVRYCSDAALGLGGYAELSWIHHGTS